MGIVVTIIMLLGLIFLLKPTLHKQAKVVVVLLIVFGCWNALWHGLRHLQEFWGIAALVSGGFMLAAALVLWQRVSPSTYQRVGLFVKGIPTLFKWAVIIGLGASFMLYFVTLVKMNLAALA